MDMTVTVEQLFQHIGRLYALLEAYKQRVAELEHALAEKEG